MIHSIYKNNILFLKLCIIWWLVCFSIYLYFGDKTILLFLNHHYNIFLDAINIMFSFFGRGDTITVIFILGLLYKPFRNNIYIKWCIIYGIYAAGITNLLKYLFNTPRPLSVYGTPTIRVIHWMDNAFWFSFPSGHTLGAFSFFSFLWMAFGIKNKYIQILFFIIAAGCGLSRIYLGQHFMSDVLFGSALGLLIGSIVGYFANKQFLNFNFKK